MLKEKTMSTAQEFDLARLELRKQLLQTPPRTAVKGSRPRAPQTPEFTGDDIRRKIIELIQIPGLLNDVERQATIALIGSNPTRAVLIDELHILERYIANIAPALEAQPAIDVSAPALQDPVLKRPPRAERRTTASVRRNGDVYASRPLDNRYRNETNNDRNAAASLERFAGDLRALDRTSDGVLLPVTTSGPRAPARQPGRTQVGFASIAAAGPPPQVSPSTIGITNPDGTGSEAERVIQSQLQKIEASVNELGAADAMLKGASPLDKVNLLRQLQQDNNLQALVAAGLMKWSDVLMSNPAKGTAGHVDGVKVGDPVVNAPKLGELRNKLLVLGQQKADTELQRVAQRQKQRVTAGYKSSGGTGDVYPGLKVWSGPRYMPGTISNPNNVES